MNLDFGRTAKIIRELRKERGLTQEKAAEEIGMNIKTLQSIEQGKRTGNLDTLCMVAEYFGVSLDYLVFGRLSGADREDGSSAEWEMLTKGLTEQQRSQLLRIASDMVHTLGWA